MEMFSRWILRHRLLVGVTWFAVTVVGVLVAPSVSGRLQSGLHMNSTALTANAQIARQYGGAAAAPGVVVLDLPSGATVDSPAVRAELRHLDLALAKTAPTVREISYASTGNRSLVGNAGGSTIVLAYPPVAGVELPTSVLDQLGTAATAAVPGATVHATSLKALVSGNSPSAHTSVFTELLIGGLGALLVLAWVFGSFLALLPLITAIVSVLTMQLLIYGLSFVMPTDLPFNPAVQYIVALLGLGLSIDYSLLIVNRWREERAAGMSNSDAVRASMQHAGHAVWFSGITASLGLFALVVVPVSLVRGIGIAGLFIPSTATLVAMTLLPVALSKLGPRLDWPRRRSTGSASRFWTWWAHTVIRHRVAAAALGLVILFGLGGAAITLNVAQPTSAAVAGSGVYADGLYALTRDGFPSGTLSTIPVWVPPGTSGSAVAASLSALSSVHGAVHPAGVAWHRGGSSLVMVLPVSETGTAAAGTSLTDVRSAVPAGTLVGGHAAVQVDAVRNAYSWFPLMFTAVAIVTFLVLAGALRSLVLPLKAVLLNALSVAATYGILVLIWQHGLGTQILWGISATGSVDTWVPILLFGFLFGISMDYEVFILSRVREGYDRTGSTGAAVVEGVSRTGRSVTSAALILFFALASMASTNGNTVRQLASGMAAGVLLDALVVRMLLLPALVSLFGRANWWLPGWVARVLRVRSASGPAAVGAVEEPVGAAIRQS